MDKKWPEECAIMTTIKCVYTVPTNRLSSVGYNIMMVKSRARHLGYSNNKGWQHYFDKHFDKFKFSGKSSSAFPQAIYK